MKSVDCEKPAAAMMNAEDAAQYIGKSKSWMDQKRSQGRGPRFVRIGSSIRYRRADLDAFLEGSVVETADTRQQAARGAKVAA